MKHKQIMKSGLFAFVIGLGVVLSNKTNPFLLKAEESQQIEITPQEMPLKTSYYIPLASSFNNNLIGAYHYSMEYDLKYEYNISTQEYIISKIQYKILWSSYKNDSAQAIFNSEEIPTKYTQIGTLTINEEKRIIDETTQESKRIKPTQLKEIKLNHLLEKLNPSSSIIYQNFTLEFYDMNNEKIAISRLYEQPTQISHNKFIINDSNFPKIGGSTYWGAVKIGKTQNNISWENYTNKMIDLQYIDDYNIEKGINLVRQNPHRYGFFTFEENAEQVRQAVQTEIERLQLKPNEITYTGIFHNIFNTLNNVLSVEIFPDITLGICIGLPLLLSLLIIIIKLIK